MKFSFFLLSVILFSSCVFFDNENNESKVSYKDQKTKEQEEIQDLEERISSTIGYIKEYDSLLNLNETLILNSDKELVYKYFNTNLTTSYGRGIKTSFNRVQLQENHLNASSFIDELTNHFSLSKENDIMRALTNSWKLPYNEMEERVSYFFSEKEQRTSNYIKTFFTKDVLNSIENSFIKTGIYENSKLGKYVEVLLSVYNNFGEEDFSRLEELYELSEIGYHKKKEEIE